MIRTQVSLDEGEYRLAQREARALGIPVAELVRRALRHALASPAVEPNAQAAWMRYAGLVESGDSHSSQTVDDVIYGRKD
jgi:Ribbon-helix-helix protein, copG family